jgi:hypothetical protein
MQWIAELKASEWLIVASTLAGPILAVQAQKWLERIRARQGRRQWVFETLMATRGARTSPDHVRALNSIELTFYGSGPMSARADRGVVEAWHEYHHHLNAPPHGNPSSPESQAAWNTKSDELFVNLLELLGKATGFNMSRDQIRTGNYSPQAHGQAEFEVLALRKLALQVLAGERSLPMRVTALPDGYEPAELQSAEKVVDSPAPAEKGPSPR